MSSLENQTKMMNPPKVQTRMVKIKANYPLRVVRPGKDSDGKDVNVEHIVKEGTTTEVTEAEASEFCDKEFNLGYKNTFGNIDSNAIKQVKVKRAERV